MGRYGEIWEPVFPLLGVRSHTRSAYVHERRLTSRPRSHQPLADAPEARGAVSEGSAVTKPSMSHCVETRERSRPSDSRCGGSACSCGCDATRASSVRVSAITPVSCAVKYDGSSRSMTHSSSQKAAWRDGEKRWADHALRPPVRTSELRRGAVPISPHISPYLPQLEDALEGHRER